MTAPPRMPPVHVPTLTEVIDVIDLDALPQVAELVSDEPVVQDPAASSPADITLRELPTQADAFSGPAPEPAFAATIGGQSAGDFPSEGSAAAFDAELPAFLLSSRAGAAVAAPMPAWATPPLLTEPAVGMPAVDMSVADMSVADMSVADMSASGIPADGLLVPEAMPEATPEQPGFEPTQAAGWLDDHSEAQALPGSSMGLEAVPAPSQPLMAEMPTPAGLTPAQHEVLQEERIVQQVLHDLQRQVDGLLEFRVREALGPILARLTDALVKDVRHELTDTLRDVVARAVHQELSRHRGR